MALDFLSCLENHELLVEAFAAIQLKPKEMVDLGELYARENGIPVSRDQGKRVRGDTVHSCSRIGSALTAHLGGARPGDLMMWIGDLQSGEDHVERWIMRPEIRAALDSLEWFPSQGKSKTARAVELKAMEQVLKEFEAATAASAASERGERLKRLFKAPRKPIQQTVVATVFQRNPDVVIEALYRAAGNCEACNQPAPFIRASDKSPYLEVHHRIPLSSGGDDTLDNAIALCPNCHRKYHYA